MRISFSFCQYIIVILSRSHRNTQINFPKKDGFKVDEIEIDYGINQNEDLLAPSWSFFFTFSIAHNFNCIIIISFSCKLDSTKKKNACRVQGTEKQILNNWKACMFVQGNLCVTQIQHKRKISPRSQIIFASSFCVEAKWQKLDNLLKRFSILLWAHTQKFTLTHTYMSRRMDAAEKWKVKAMVRERKTHKNANRESNLKLNWNYKIRKAQWEIPRDTFALSQQPYLFFSFFFYAS